VTQNENFPPTLDDKKKCINYSSHFPHSCDNLEKVLADPQEKKKEIRKCAKAASGDKSGANLRWRG